MIDLEKLKAHLNTPEAKESMRKFAEKIVNNRNILSLQLERAHSKYDERFSEMIEKILIRYDKGEYIDRWYKRGYEPPETLLYFVLDYARKYGTDVDSIKEIKKYGNMFTSELYKYKGYYIGLMVGQGSAVTIQKEEL